MNSWIKNAIIYHIFIDRFAGFDPKADDTKPDWIGGNIRGIIEKLPYLKSLGVNCIWISPFYKNSAYHGYHITDFYEVDEHLGTKEELKELINKCRKAEINTIIGNVPNHCSYKHPFFLDAQKNTNSKYKNWFTFTKWPNEYLTFLHCKELPKLNLDNKETRDYIIKNAIYWIEELGTDGLRLDHSVGPSHDFWREFVTKAKKKKKDLVLIGEVWFEGVTLDDLKTIEMRGDWMIYLLNKYFHMRDPAMLNYVGVLDGCLDFTFNRLVRDFVAKESISEKEFRERLKKHYDRFPKNFLLPTFLDNHDMNRYLFEAGGDKEKLKKAAEI